LSVIEIKQKISFNGGDADNHRVDAYAAAHSLEGLVWALTLTTHFGVTGKVRQRGDLSSSVKIFLSPPKRGSVINELNILVQEHPFISLVVGGYTVNTVTPYINSLITYSFKSTLNGVRQIPFGAKRFFKHLKDDDVDKLIDRIEPPLTRAHSAIGKSVDSMSLTYRRKKLATLDLESKVFLETRAREDFQTIETNITSFNVLTGNGRLYHPDEGATVPFSLSGSSLSGSQEVLTTSMNQYSMGRRGVVKLTAQRVETLEGRLKQLIVSSAEEIPPVDWDNGIDPMRSLREQKQGI
jgi:hypothetical protein